MSYLSDLESKLTPEQYQALVKPMQFQAKKSYKGVPQDWQAQILMPLDVSKLNTPKQLAIIPASTKTVMVDVGEGGAEARKVVTPASLDKSLSKLYTPITETNGGAGDGEEAVSTVVGYKSKTPIDVNGVPVYAKYDANGSLTGYEGASNKRLYVNDSTSYKGVWDATGKAAPKVIVAEGGGFVKGFIKDVMSDPVLGKVAQIAAATFGGPLGSAALNAATTAAQGGDLGDVLESGAKAGLLTLGAQKVTGLLSGGDVGGVTGPDNIDVGGGWSPATGATAAELATARAAIDAALPDNIDAGGGWSPATGATEAELSAARDALSTVPSQPITANQITEAIKADNIDVGGGYNPATGTGDVATATAAAETGVTNYVTADDITNTITGNADKKALYSNEGYGDTLTSEQINAIDKAVAGGMSVKDAIDMVRAGLLINTIAGDPLDIMGGGSGTGGTSGSTGFAQVPIPAEWKSPTYAPIAGPIDLSTILSSQNMLGGTQWQNLPSQRNVTFNDIFAAGQQQTPMGSPVDLNNIVSAILGQTATSQKPA